MRNPYRALIMAVILSFWPLLCLAQTPNNSLTTEFEEVNWTREVAGQICVSVQEIGSSQTITMSMEANSGLMGLITRLANVGFNGSAQYQSTEYSGVLQKDLAEALMDESDCRQHVFDTLMNRLFSLPVDPKATRLITVDSITDQGQFSEGIMDPIGTSRTYLIRGPFLQENGADHISVVIGVDDSDPMTEFPGPPTGPEYLQIANDQRTLSPRISDEGSADLDDICLDPATGQAAIVAVADSGGTDDGNGRLYYGVYDDALSSFQFSELGLVGSLPDDDLCTADEGFDISSKILPKQMEICTCNYNRLLSLHKIYSQMYTFFDQPGPKKADTTVQYLTPVSPGQSPIGQSLGKIDTAIVDDEDVSGFVDMINNLPDKSKSQFRIRQVSSGSYEALAITDVDDANATSWTAILARNSSSPDWNEYYFQDVELEEQFSSVPPPTLISIDNNGSFRFVSCVETWTGYELQVDQAGNATIQNYVTQYPNPSQPSLGGDNLCED